MKRRAFLSLLTGSAAAGMASVLPAPAAKAAGGEFPGYPDSNGILTDLTKCIGCRKCEEACARVNDLPAPVPVEDRSVFETVRRTGADSFTVVNRYEAGEQPVFRKMQCMHCLEPACATACFVKAFTKNSDGSVTYDPDHCVGCRYCMVACPFNIPAYTYDKVLNPVIRKCTMCHSLQEQGKLPGCVADCPTGALLFGKRRELIEIARQRIMENPDRYVNHIYGEHEMGGTAWLTISGVDFSKVGMRGDLGTKAAAEYTTGVLGALPMVVGFWPVLLGGAYLISKRREEMAGEEREEAVRAAVAEEQERGEAAMRKALEQAARDAEKEKAAAVEAARKEAERIAEEGRKESGAGTPDGEGE